MLPTLLRSNYVQYDAYSETEPVYFSAGWYYGLTGIDKRDQAMKCANGNIVQFVWNTTVLYEAMNAYISGDQQLGYTKMKEAKELWIENYEILGDYGHAGCDIALEMGAYYKKQREIASRPDWAKDFKQIYDANKQPITAAFNSEIENWKAEDFFHAGMYMG